MDRSHDHGDSTGHALGISIAIAKLESIGSKTGEGSKASVLNRCASRRAIRLEDQHGHLHMAESHSRVLQATQSA